MPIDYAISVAGENMTDSDSAKHSLEVAHRNSWRAVLLGLKWNGCGAALMLLTALPLLFSKAASSNHGDPSAKLAMAISVFMALISGTMLLIGSLHFWASPVEFGMRALGIAISLSVLLTFYPSIRNLLDYVLIEPAIYSSNRDPANLFTLIALATMALSAISGLLWVCFMAAVGRYFDDATLPRSANRYLVGCLLYATVVTVLLLTLEFSTKPKFLLGVAAIICLVLGVLLCAYYYFLLLRATARVIRIGIGLEVEVIQKIEVPDIDLPPPSRSRPTIDGGYRKPSEPRMPE